MTYKSVFRPLIVLFALLISITFSGVFAAWTYYSGPSPVDSVISVGMSGYKYGPLYTTKIQVKGGSYSSASLSQIGDLNMGADIELNANAASSVVVEVTFYNNTDTSFYYNKTEAISTDNKNIEFVVSGIEQEDEVAPRSYKTIEVTFKFSGNNYSKRSLLTELHFNFVLNPDDIGGVVAQTAVDRFRDVLNNVVAEDSYQTLENAMNNRSGINKASAVTYIGNVAGSSSSDSQVVGSLFGEEFMSMDLDGDGKAESITMMIKRENLDNNLNTGDSYTYSNWGRQYTVTGVEMTLYITSENLNNVSSGKSVTVYAVVFTKEFGSGEWTELVPLTKGTASANNYSGYGSANSFNTDTWKSDEGKTIKELAVQ